jgi:tetratricopeptide (TPR) repeat protein
MKKFLFLASAMLMFALPAANAQNVNTNNEINKLKKVDLSLENPKKNIKASTWLAHGKAYTDAYILPTKEIGRGVPVQVLQMNVGEPKNMYEGEFQGTPMIVLDYEYVDIYINPTNYLIEGWNQKKAIKENLAQTAIASLKKAYEMDAKLESKIASVALNLANALMQQGDALNSVGRTLDAAECFELAYRAESIVPSTTANGDNIFNSGMLWTMHAASLQGEEAMAAFAKGETLLNEALAAGYNDETGNIYYYLFHCYYGQREAKDRMECLKNAKDVLLTGIKLYPRNTNILDGLMNLYTLEDGVGDPAEILTMIEEALAENPTNYDMWFGRGRVYFALKNFDECLNSFKKCAEIRPDEFDSNYYVGYFIIEKANTELDKLNANTEISYEQYGEENAKINLIYAEAIPWLEKAHGINPTDASTISYLNSLCYRLRDMDGMMDKYNKYHELYMNL